MPKRWERDLRRLGDVPAPIDDIRARSVRPSDGHTPSTSLPPIRQRVVAGIVAFGVFIAAGAFLLRAIDPTGAERPVEIGKAPLPSLRVVFTTTRAGLIGSGDSPREVEVRTEYGDIRDVSVTSTSPRDDPYASPAKELQPLFPSPTVGSPVSLETDGYDPRIMVVKVGDWPSLSSLNEVDRLPTDPGRYVMLFHAEYPEGVATIARTVDLAAPGAVQVAATEGGKIDAASASLTIDGETRDGFLVTSSFTQSDVGAQSPPREPSFSDDDYIEVDRAAELVRDRSPSGLLTSVIPAGDGDDRLGIGSTPAPEDLFDVDPGRYLLIVQTTWKHGKTGYFNEGTLEEALFHFPIKIVQPQATELNSILDYAPPRSYEGETLDGRPLDPTGFQDRAIIAVAWASWCDPCRDTLAEIQDWTEISRLTPKAVGIVERSDADRARRMARDHDITFPTVIAADRDRWGLSILPTVWVMTPNGSVVARRAGSVDRDWLADAVYEATFGEAASSGTAAGAVQFLLSEGLPGATLEYRGLEQVGITSEPWVQVDMYDGHANPDVSTDDFPYLVEVPAGAEFEVSRSGALEGYTWWPQRPEDSEGGQVIPSRLGSQVFYLRVGLKDGTNYDVAFGLDVVESPSEEGLTVNDWLGCWPQIPFHPTAPGVDLPAGASYITDNVEGMRPGDQVAPMDGGVDESWGPWLIARDSVTIAWLDYRSLSGVACEGSSIGGV